MRLAVISDIHGNLVALEAVLADIKGHGVDQTINLGDCCTSPLWPRETFELLDTLKLPTVRGNHDRAQSEPVTDELPPSALFTRGKLSDAQRAALGRLPSELRPHEEILAVHGTPSSDTSYLIEERIAGRLVPTSAATIAERLGNEHARVVLCGHSHLQNMEIDALGRLVVNPGSVGCPNFADRASNLASGPRAPHAKYAILTRRALSWSVELVALAYDWDRAAERALANGRPEWAGIYAINR